MTPAKNASPDDDKTTLHHFADATLLLADAAAKFSASVDEIKGAVDEGIAEIDTGILGIQRLVEEKENLRNLEASIEAAKRRRRFWLMIGAVAFFGIMVVAFSAVILAQNRSASEQRKRIDGVLAYLVNCTTATPGATPQDPHPAPHGCYESGQAQQGKAVGTLAYASIFAVDCRAGGSSGSALVQCVNDRLAAFGFPGLSPPS